MRKMLQFVICGTIICVVMMCADRHLCLSVMLKGESKPCHHYI